MLTGKLSVALVAVLFLALAAVGNAQSEFFLNMWSTSNSDCTPANAPDYAIKASFGACQYTYFCPSNATCAQHTSCAPTSSVRTLSQYASCVGCSPLGSFFMTLDSTTKAVSFLTYNNLFCNGTSASFTRTTYLSDSFVSGGCAKATQGPSSNINIASIAAINNCYGGSIASLTTPPTFASPASAIESGLISLF